MQIDIEQVSKAYKAKMLENEELSQQNLILVEKTK